MNQKIDIKLTSGERLEFVSCKGFKYTARGISFKGAPAQKGKLAIAHIMEFAFSHTEIKGFRVINNYRGKK